MGAIVNFLSIILGSIVGMMLKKGIPDKINKTITHGVGLCVVLIGINGALEGKNTLITILSIVLGAIIGEAIDIDSILNRLAASVEKRLNRNGGNTKFASGFVS